MSQASLNKGSANKIKNSFIIYCVVALLILTGIIFEGEIQSKNIKSLTINSHAKIITSIKNINHEVNLFDVNDWLYVYSGAEAKDIINTEFDLVDIDPDGFNHNDIFNMKNSDKIVIAYISIGEAEEYRYYWDPNADYLLEENPDWPECWYVDYSSKEWQDLIINEYIPQIKEKGFDGLYLDTVDTYHFEERYPACTKEHMIDFIKNISSVHRSSEFYIIPQNGLEIAPEIADYINGIGVEEIYYRAFYIHFFDFHINGIPQNPFLRINKEKVMSQLLDKGKIVLTLDYATLRFQVDHCYRISREMGYTPYVSTAKLDQIFVHPGN